MPTAGWWETLWPNPAGVLEAAGLKPKMDAIDLCCGDGWFTSEMAKVARRVVAIDIDSNMLDVARDRLSKAGTTNCDVVEGDAYELTKLVRTPPDFVFMANAFHGVPDQPRLAQAVCPDVEAGRPLCRCQLASAATRENHSLGRATGTKD